MFIVALFAATGIATGATQPEWDGEDSVITEHARAGASRGGGSGKKGGGRKKGKKKGKKGGGKGSRAESGNKRSQRSMAPWGKARIAVSGGLGYNYGILREAPETGAEGESRTGSSSKSCTGNECTESDTNTNAASGWGPHSELAVVVPGLGGLPATLGPRISWSRNSLHLDGLKHSRPVDTRSEDLTTAFTTDRATYHLALQQVDVGFNIATKFSKRNPLFLTCNLGAGYAWGTVDTMLRSAPGQTVSGGVRGVSVGFDFGVGLSLGTHAHVVFMPFITPNWISLRPDDPASFPFLQDQKAHTTTLPAKIEVIAAF